MHGGEPADRVGALRGAGVGSVDTRRLGRILVGVVLATLAVLVVVFTVVGVHKNHQNDRLHNDGVPVTFTVTSCTGLLGGSGSNVAGYVCHGTLHARRPHLQRAAARQRFHRPGSTVPAVAVPGDPALVSPAAMVATEHSSAGVFVVPRILSCVLARARRAACCCATATAAARRDTAAPSIAADAPEQRRRSAGGARSRSEACSACSAGAAVRSGCGGALRARRRRRLLRPA